jgi:hypothetical protein
VACEVPEDPDSTASTGSNAVVLGRDLSAVHSDRLRRELMREGPPSRILMLTAATEPSASRRNQAAWLSRNRSLMPAELVATALLTVTKLGDQSARSICAAAAPYCRAASRVQSWLFGLGWPGLARAW